MISPIREVSHILMEQYGYEVCDVVSGPITEQHDIMFRSGSVIVMLKNDNPRDQLIMTVIKDHLKVENKIKYESTNLPASVLTCLLEFALITVAPP